MTHAREGTTGMGAARQPGSPASAESADLPRRALDYLTDGILLLDEEGNVLYLNAAAENLLGVSETLPGTPWQWLLDPGSDAELVHETLTGGPGGERTAILRTENGLHTVDMACVPLPEDEGGALLRLAPNRGAGLDSEVLYRARHDPVTGAYNRWEMENRLTAALRRS
ncbi:MAG: PAS domain-containing protein, partial [Pseudomonadota bacterium]